MPLTPNLEEVTQGQPERAFALMQNTNQSQVESYTTMVHMGQGYP